ncbi:MAG: SDR family oxidoreductase [Acidimicrobiia bacterium]|jgi:NAD(P)-dependent dehydrogenase (short-subunit alcohol dehydrogenase family)
MAADRGQATLGSPATGVIVTGGGSGIGRACCLALADVGRPVAAWDVDGDGASETARLCAERGTTATSATVDVTVADAVAAARDATVGAIGSVGGLVHAAGIVRPALEDVVDLDTWDAVLNVNLRAEALLVSTLMPTFRAAAPGAAIVGISSIEGLIGHGFIPSYVASKHALIGLTRSLAHRLGPDGIRANAVCPGYIETPMLAPTIATPEARASFEHHVPIGRLGQPEDIARVVRFLLSDEAAYMNGAVVVVDGGVTAVGGQEALGG